MRICKKCLLRDLAEADQRNLRKYLDAIRDEDRAEEPVTESRLAICRACEQLSEATCISCGCYVEIRAALRDGRCPKKKW